MSDKKQILEPISTLGRIIMLGYMPVTTKFGIDNHRLIIQKNDYSLKQASIRWWYSFSREQIACLFDPIVRLIFWYFINKDVTEYEDEIDKFAYSGSIDDVERYEESELIDEIDRFENGDIDTNFIRIKELPEMKKYLKMFVDGIDKLKETYDSGNTYLALQYYKTLINSVITNKFDENMLPKEYLLSWKKKEGLLNVDQIKNLWQPNDLKKLYQLFTQCEQIKLNTSNQSEIEKQTCGILKSVDAILSLYEDRFCDMIKLSNEG